MPAPWRRNDVCCSQATDPICPRNHICGLYFTKAVYRHTGFRENMNRLNTVPVYVVLFTRLKGNIVQTQGWHMPENDRDDNNADLHNPFRP
ncbi:hypothetical protein MSKU9_2484 [Komagataeibacter diospyri]|uniref:Uncharacterized protein n=1 Tax=Komagataeibacter diospyri TaxID=1932662 RepID=A0A4P5NS46_9PROT|nr:hypothetical protein MSKU9_2484 [Komagataeibacter diospyri]